MRSVEYSLPTRTKQEGKKISVRQEEYLKEVSRIFLPGPWFQPLSFYSAVGNKDVVFSIAMSDMPILAHLLAP